MSDETRLALMKYAEEITSRRSLSELAAEFGTTNHFNQATSQPTPVQGEALPVVAEIVVESCDEPGVTDDSFDFNVLQDAQFLGYGKHNLTLHAQATAEIARLQGEVENREWCIAEVQRTQQKMFALEDQLATLRTQLYTALAESGEMKCKLDKATLVAVAMLAVCYEVEKKNPRNPMGRLSIEDYSEKMVAEIEKQAARHTTTQESAE